MRLNATSLLARIHNCGPWETNTSSRIIHAPMAFVVARTSILRTISDMLHYLVEWRREKTSDNPLKLTESLTDCSQLTASSRIFWREHRLESWDPLKASMPIRVIIIIGLIRDILLSPDALFQDDLTLLFPDARALLAFILSEFLKLNVND